MAFFHLDRLAAGAGLPSFLPPLDAIVGPGPARLRYAAQLGADLASHVMP